MTDYFENVLPDSELKAVSSLSLAYVGDAVFELLVRSHLCENGCPKQGEMHREATLLVSAPAQARAAKKLLPQLTENEEAVLKRGRNANSSHGIPKNATHGEYALATGLEAIFGWLWLRGEKGRINELFDFIINDQGAV